MNNNLQRLNLKIDFMGIGAPKCGTEWIVACLKEHPQINFSRHKEVNYFLSPTKGINNFIYNNVRIKTPNEYVKEFSSDCDKKKGEYNNHYIFDLNALKKVKKNFPDIKIILALRNPIDYLNSLFWYMKHSNAYHLFPSTFEEALISSNDDDLFHKKHGLFGLYVKNLFSIFDRTQVLIVSLDDIKNNPHKTISQIYDHIGVNSDYVPSNLNKRINPTTPIRSPQLIKLIRLGVVFIEKIGMNWLINNIINTDNPVKLLYKKLIHSSHAGYPKVSQKTYKKLFNYFKEDQELLKRLTRSNQ